MTVFWLGLVTLAASFIGTITGFGISTIMVPVVLFLLPLPETLLFVGLVHWFGDLWKIILFKHAVNWKILLFFALPGIITGILGAYLVFQIPENLLTRGVGAVLVLYSLYLLLKPNFKIKASATAALVGGAGSGFLGGLSGVGGGALRALVLTAFNLPKEMYIFTSGLIGFAIDASRIVTYFAGGTRIPRELLVGMAVFIPVSFLGARLAKAYVKKISQERFRILVVGFLLLIGLKFVIAP